MRQQRRLGGHAEPPDFFGREPGQFRELGRGRIIIDVGVGEEQRAAGQDQHRHRVHPADVGPGRDDRQDVSEMLPPVSITADQSAIHLALP